MSTAEQSPTGGPPVLVFGDDGSPSADVAWLWLNNHRWPGWVMRVVTGDPGPPPASAWGVPPRAERWTPPWGRRFFDEDELESIEYLKVDADPRLVIDEQPADVVVVGRRGLGAVRSFWEVSTTEWLAQVPAHPLVIVRSAAMVRRVTCCVDGSSHARAAIEAAVRLPLFHDAAVTLLAVDDGNIDTAAALREAEQLVLAAGRTVRAVTTTGRAPQCVLDHLRDEEPELLVLGTRGWTAWGRIGSVAARVVHHSAGNCLLATAAL